MIIFISNGFCMLTQPAFLLIIMSERGLFLISFRPLRMFPKQVKAAAVSLRLNIRRQKLYLMKQSICGVVCEERVRLGNTPTRGRPRLFGVPLVCGTFRFELLIDDPRSPTEANACVSAVAVMFYVSQKILACVWAVRTSCTACASKSCPQSSHQHGFLECVR